MVVERLCAVDARVLRAAIGVVDQLVVGAVARWPSAIRKASRTRSVRMCAASCQPTIIRPKASSTNAKKMRPLPATQVGDVSDPELVRALPLMSRWTRSGRRGACTSGRVVRQGLPRRLAPWIPARPHQPLHSAARHLLAGTPKRLPHPPVTVGVVVGGVQFADPGEQALVLDRSRRATAAAPLVVGGHRHAPGSCRSADPEAAAMLVDVPAHFGSVWVEFLGEKHARRLQDLVRAAPKSRATCAIGRCSRARAGRHARAVPPGTSLVST